MSVCVSSTAQMLEQGQSMIKMINWINRLNWMANLIEEVEHVLPALFILGLVILESNRFFNISVNNKRICAWHMAQTDFSKQVIR